MAALSELRTAIDKFNQQFPRPGMKQCEVSASYDLPSDWPKTWPSSDHAGVYVLLNQEEEVLYVGKASFNRSLGSRLGDYFCYGENREASIKQERLKDQGVRYVVTIGVEHGHEFEAGAIEEYLIHELQPRLNVVGRRTSLI